MSVIDSTRQTPNRLVKPPDVQTADGRPTFRRPKIVLPVPTPALKFQKVQPGVPDSQLTREATGLLHEFSTPLLFNHSHRVFLWANELGRQTGEPFDAELLFVCAAFHDLGLLKKFSSEDDRFEVDSANAVRQFLEHRDVPPARIQVAWDAISLHTTPGIAAYKPLEVELLYNGVGLDVLGIGYEHFPEDLRKKIVDQYPRVKTMQGIQYMTDEEAAVVIGADRDSQQRDLFGSIERGDYPKWRFSVQIMPEMDAEKTPYNPFDLTKVWPHGDYPLIDVGVLELNRNPENYFAEVEQSAFAPSNVVPGISFSPDKMLQFRNFSYADAHRYRLGSPNYQELPVNKPRCPVHTYSRDGFMRFDGNYGGAVNYEPNSFGGPGEDHRLNEPPFKISGDADRYDRYDQRPGDDDYTQPGNLFRLMTKDEQQRLFANTDRAMKGVPEEIKLRWIRLCAKADPEYGSGLAKQLGIDPGQAMA